MGGVGAAPLLAKGVARGLLPSSQPSPDDEEGLRAVLVTHDNTTTTTTTTSSERSNQPRASPKLMIRNDAKEIVTADQRQ